jgi:hypothetical protein
MKFTLQPPSWLLFTAATLSLVLPTNALYFYMDATTPRCFMEELPKDTLVVGTSPHSSLFSPSSHLLLTPSPPSGHYEANQYDPTTQSYVPAPSISIAITVDETFDADHRVVSQRGAAKGRFTFTAADAGDHRICFAPSGAPAGGWLSGGMASGERGAIKFSLDLAIGETSNIESTDKGKLDDIVQKVRDLNGRLQDIKREQVFQRVCMQGREDECDVERC